MSDETPEAKSQRLIVPGHALKQAGMAYRIINHKWQPWQKDSFGWGRCSCGASSPLLASDTQRKAWHKDHRRRVLDEVEEEWTPRRIEDTLKSELVLAKARHDPKLGMTVVTLPWEDMLRLIDACVADTPWIKGKPPHDVLKERLERWERLNCVNPELTNTLQGGRA